MPYKRFSRIAYTFAIPSILAVWDEKRVFQHPQAIALRSGLAGFGFWADDRQAGRDGLPVGLVPTSGMSRFFRSERLFPMKKPTRHLIAEVPHRQSRVEMTIGIDLGDVWSHYCTLNEEGEVVDQGRFNQDISRRSILRGPIEERSNL
jgi:hypothetical protein